MFPLKKKSFLRFISLLLLLAALCGSAAAAGWEQFDYPADLSVKNAPYMKYWVYVPENAGPGLPLVIYLHSSDGISWSAIKDVLPVFITDGTVPSPQAYVLVPQLTRDHRLTWSNAMVSLNAVVEKTIADYQVDPERIALTGFSLGGIGLWELASLAPERYTRLLCVGGRPASGTDPAAFTCCEEIRVFSSTGDLKRNRVESEQFVESLLDAGVNASYEVLSLAHTEGPRLVYADKDIQKWLWLIPEEDPEAEEEAAPESTEEISEEADPGSTDPQ